jgi:hypothetical protein
VEILETASSLRKDFARGGLDTGIGELYKTFYLDLAVMEKGKQALRLITELLLEALFRQLGKTKNSRLMTT